MAAETEDYAIKKEDLPKIMEEYDILAREMVKREKVDEKELEQIEDARALQNISNMPARVKCAELAWYTMQKLLND